MDINGDWLRISIAIICGYLTGGYGYWGQLVSAVPRDSQIAALLLILLLGQVFLRSIKKSLKIL